MTAGVAPVPVTPKVDDLFICLISLQRATERRAAVVAQLEGLGLRYRIFDAVDGRAREAALLKNADPAAYARNMGSPILPGKLGVYASHMAVWQEFLATEHEIALVFEDDVVIGPRFLESVAAALSGKAHWDLIRFSAVRAKLPIRQGRLGAFDVNAYAGPFTGNAAYLIKRDLATRLLPRLLPQTRAMDHELNRFFLHDYRQLGLEPFSVQTDDGQLSTITGQNFADVKKFHWTKRLPHYRLKAANYLRRIGWLAKKGMLLPSSRDLGGKP